MQTEVCQRIVQLLGQDDVAEKQVEILRLDTFYKVRG